VTTRIPAARGRPRSVSPEAVAAIAFDLFDQQGFSATTMEDIARASGVSRPTLFRYFASKGAILWFHYEERTCGFRALLFASAPELPILDAVFETFLQQLLERGEEQMAITRRRIVIGLRESGTTIGEQEHQEEWEAIVAEFIASRLGREAVDLDSRVLASAIWNGLWTGVRAWAADEIPGEGPRSYLDRARRLLAGSEVLGR